MKIKYDIYTAIMTGVAIIIILKNVFIVFLLGVSSIGIVMSTIGVSD